MQLFYAFLPRGIFLYGDIAKRVFLCYTLFNEVKEGEIMPMTTLKVIPMPKKVLGEDNEGRFASVSVEAAICTDHAAFSVHIDTLVTYTAVVHGVTLTRGAGGIRLCCDAALDAGEYRVVCAENGVTAYAADDDGAAYAMATLLQLMAVESDRLVFPKTEICDRPDCGYRSLMVDLARQWHPFPTLFAYVDLCYLYKIKYLHLHFVDTQSYTLPSDIFPKIATEGRAYNKEQIREINAYAHARGVELIPEFEVPGHARAMVEAYPELFAHTPLTEGEKVSRNIVCVGRAGLMENLKKLIEEIIEMFPYSRYLHLGGDEAEIAAWDRCADCTRYMAERGIPNVHALYSHFTKEVTDLVLSLGRTPIVWEGFPKEGTEEISRDVVVIAWESYYHLAPDLIEEGFDIINASWQPLYVTPTVHWSVENILAWNVYNWQHWWPKSEAHLNPIHLQPTDRVLGGLLCAWEWNYEGEIDVIKENLAALSERTWRIRRYVEDSEFRERLSHVLPIADKLCTGGGL